MLRSTVAAIATTLTLAAAPALAAAAEAPRLQPVDAAMQKLIDDGQLAGAVTYAARDGKVVHFSALGKRDLAGGAPAEKDTIFRVIRPGYQFDYNGVVVTDPAAVGVAMGKGSYLWDGAAQTWFWVDPTNRLVFVGMVQRIAGPDAPLVQPISQQAVKRALDLN
jgi:CubicO group peptidase (beta-lactamase class C family)